MRLGNYLYDNSTNIEGKLTLYFPNGQRYIERFFVHSRPEGLMIKWHNNGKQEEERYYKHGAHIMAYLVR